VPRIDHCREDAAAAFGRVVDPGGPIDFGVDPFDGVGHGVLHGVGVEFGRFAGLGVGDRHLAVVPGDDDVVRYRPAVEQVVGRLVQVGCLGDQIVAAVTAGPMSTTTSTLPELLKMLKLPALVMPVVTALGIGG